MSQLRVDEITDELGTGSPSFPNKIPSGSMPAGSVIQVVDVIYDPGVESQTTSTSFINTGLEASITPTSTSSKILILVHDNLRTFSTFNDMEAEYGLFEGSNELIKFKYGRRDGGDNGIPTFVTLGSFSYIHSPSTTLEITYKTMIRVRNSSYFTNWNYTANKSTITLMEIAV